MCARRSRPLDAKANTAGPELLDAYGKTRKKNAAAKTANGAKPTKADG